MATSVTQPGTANVLQGTDALTIVLTVPSLPDGMLCILVTEAGFGGTVANIVDSAGHNYMTNLHQSTDPVNNNFSAFSYINNCQGYTGGKTITVTWTAPMHAYLRLFWYFQGEMVLDQWDVTHLSAPTGSFSGATLTPKYEGSLIFSYLATHTSAGDFAVSNINVGAGFRALGSIGSGTDSAEDLVQATIAPIAATWTSDVNSRNSVWTLVFRPYGWIQNNNNNASAYIQTSVTTSNYSFLNGPVNVGHTVVLFFGWNDATVDAPVVTDNATGFTNNYTVLAPLAPGDAHVWYVVYCSNVRGHPTQLTIVTQHTVNTILTQICELGGSWTFDSVDKKKTNGPSTYPLGTVTPARNGALIYAVSVQYSGAFDTTRVSGPFRRTFTQVIEPATMIQSTAATITPNYSTSENTGLGSFVLAFDPALQLPLTAGLAGNSNLAMAVTGALPAMATMRGASATLLDLQQQAAQIVTQPPLVSTQPPSASFFVPSQDVIAFKSHLPIFASINDADVAAALNTARIMVPDDGVWSNSGYPLALRYYAAWLLSMIQLQSWSASLMSLSGSSMAGGAADLYVSAIRFGERDVSFGRRVPVLSNRTTLGPGEDLLSLNIWGQMFQQLRYRNVVPVMIV